ncbi:hypothetical protein KGQ64_09200 [bacterium]|nr:hypothetical protein [bacterium]
MDRVRNEDGLIMVVALGIVAVLAALTLAVATSGQMTTVTSALSTHGGAAFHVADGTAHYALGDDLNFVPYMASRTTNLRGTTADLDGSATSTYAEYRALPGNVLVRTADGQVRAAQFGQAEGLGKMYIFRVDAKKNTAAAGIDPAGTVSMRVAKAAPCPDCG